MKMPQSEYTSAPLPTSPMSVSALNREAKLLIEQCFPNVLVTGEISNCMRPRSGHYYFSLKDSNAQISCAFFKGYHGQLAAALEDGMQVNVRGKLSIYPERGNYQLLVTALELAGDGALKAQYEPVSYTHLTLPTKRIV